MLGVRLVSQLSDSLLKDIDSGRGRQKELGANGESRVWLMHSRADSYA